MATVIEELLVKLDADLGDLKTELNKATNEGKKTANKFKSNFKSIRGSIKGASNAVFSLKGAIAGLGLGLIAKSFLDAGRTTEEFRIRLNALTGSAAAGNQVFQDASKFAANVAFEYKDILGAATQLSGVVKGGPEEIKALLPVIADLATVSGLSITDTTSQVQRMLSAGAASADQFRERGILAMLGFQAGVSVSAEETRKQLIAAFEDPQSKFRDASKEMANTWTGMTSLVSDKWFQFRDAVMGAGLFDFLKALVKQFDVELGDALLSNKETAQKFSIAVVDGLIVAGEAVGIFADSMNGIKIIINILKATLQGFVIFVTEIFAGLAILVQESFNDVISAFNFAIEASPFALGLKKIEKIDFVSGLVADVETTKAALAETLSETHDLLTEDLPSTAIENRLMAARESMVAAQEEARKTAESFKVLEPEEGGLELPSGRRLGEAKTDEGEANEEFLTGLQERLDALTEANRTELEIIEERFTSERLMLRAGLDNKLLDEEDFMSSREELEQRHQDTLFDIEQTRLMKQAKEEAKFNKLRFQVAEGIASNLSVLMDTSSKKQFRIGKLAAKSTVVIKGIEAVQSSYAAGAEIGGPILGVAFAATAAIASAAQLAKINSASFGGGGGISAPGGTSPSTGGASTVPPGVPSQNILQGGQQALQQQGGGPQIVINIQGDVFDSDGTGERIADLISDAVEGRGVRLVSSEVV